MFQNAPYCVEDSTWCWLLGHNIWLYYCCVLQEQIVSGPHPHWPTSNCCTWYFVSWVIKWPFRRQILISIALYKYKFWACGSNPRVWLIKYEPLSFLLIWMPPNVVLTIFENNITLQNLFCTSFKRQYGSSRLSTMGKKIQLPMHPRNFGFEKTVLFTFIFFRVAHFHLAGR